MLKFWKSLCHPKRSIAAKFLVKQKVFWRFYACFTFFRHFLGIIIRYLVLRIYVIFFIHSKPWFLVCFQVPTIILLCIDNEISKIAHLNWFPKFKIFFWRAHLPHTVFRFILTPRTMSNSWTRKNKKVYFAKRNFLFFALFSPFFELDAVWIWALQKWV